MLRHPVLSPSFAIVVDIVCLERVRVVRLLLGEGKQPPRGLPPCAPPSKALSSVIKRQLCHSNHGGAQPTEAMAHTSRREPGTGVWGGALETPRETCDYGPGLRPPPSEDFHPAHQTAYT